MGRRLAIGLIVALLAAALVAPAASAEGNSDVRVYIQTSSVYGVGQSIDFRVVVLGTDAGVWKYEYYLDNTTTKANMTGATPLKAQPSRGNITDTTLELNATMPSVPGAFDIFLNVTKTIDTGSLWQTARVRVDVVEPINLTCRVKNPTDLDMKDVPCQIFVDGTLVQNQTVALISAGKSANVTAQWYTKEPGTGSHDVEFRFDLNGDGDFASENEDLTISYKIYTKGQGVDWLLVFTVTIAIFATVIGVILIRRRPLK
jgi:hypothetical protein